MLQRKNLSTNGSGWAPKVPRSRSRLLPALLLAPFLVCLPLLAQSSAPPLEPQVPEAGGPQGDLGPMVIPKKADEPPPERPQPTRNPAGMPTITIRKDVPLVNLDVMVLTSKGQPIPNLGKENFKVLEDGVPQTISNFGHTEAPITAVLLVEFANGPISFMYDALNASYTFANMLKPQDWVAVVEYDMRPHILTDFTQDKRAILAALNQLRIPGFSERNMFDALYDTLDRIDGIEGRKYVILVGSGLDTFSKLTFDKILKKVQATKDVTIFPISTGFMFREYMETRHGMNPDVNVAMMNYTQADNELRTFAKMTGGQAYFPRLQGDMGDVFRDIAMQIRNQYTIAYHPTNSKQDGTYRKLKVELQAPDGGPLTLRDQKGKSLKVNIIAREGYTAKHEVE